jgi:hypothetical protein
MVQWEGTRTCTDHDHKYRANFYCAVVQDVLHDALRVSDGTRAIGEIEDESNADFLGMTISVICLADRVNKASRSKSFYAFIRLNVPFCSHALAKVGWTA